MLGGCLGFLKQYDLVGGVQVGGLGWVFLDYK